MKSVCNFRFPVFHMLYGIGHNPADSFGGSRHGFNKIPESYIISVNDSVFPGIAKNSLKKTHNLITGIVSREEYLKVQTI